MEKNLKLICPKCGTPHQPHSPHTMDADGFERCEIRTVMEDRGVVLRMLFLAKYVRQAQRRSWMG
jgi:hypothetical protein